VKADTAEARNREAFANCQTDANRTATVLAASRPGRLSPREPAVAVLVGGLAIVTLMSVALAILMTRVGVSLHPLRTRSENPLAPTVSD